MPGALSVTAVRHAVMFHISGCAVSLMFMCVRPCDRGLGDRDVERRARGCTPGTAATPALLHERKKTGKKFQAETLRERNPERRIHLAAAAAAWPTLPNTLFHFAQIWKVVCSIKGLKLQIQYFPSRFSEGSADYVP